MIVANNDFFSIDFFSNQNYILVRRKYSSEVNFEEYKNIIDEWIAIIKKYKPDKQLIDYSDLTVPIKAEFQKYAYEHLVIPSAKISIKKIAFIISQNLLAQMTVENIMDKGSALVKYKYFDNFNKAKNWLLQ